MFKRLGVFGTKGQLSLGLLLIGIFSLTACGGGGILSQSSASIPILIIPMTVRLFSDAGIDSEIANGQKLPDQFSCKIDPQRAGRETGQKANSPFIRWYNTPAGAKSMLIMVDLANIGSFPEEPCISLISGGSPGCVYWQLYNINPSQGFLPVIPHTSDGDIRAYETDISSLGDGFSGISGPHWKSASMPTIRYDDASGGGAKDNPDPAEGNYYLGPCADSEVNQDHIYEFTVFALSTVIATSPLPNYNRATFEDKYGGSILDKASVFVKRRGEQFYITIPGADGTNPNEEPNTDLPIKAKYPEPALVQAQDYSPMVCSNNPFDKPDPAKGIYPQGLSPKLQWFNLPGSSDNLAIFMDNQTMEESSLGSVSKRHSLSSAPILGVNAPSSGGTVPPYQIDGQNINCSFERCKNWSIFNVRPAAGSSVIFRGGIGSNDVPVRFKELPLSGGNMYTFALRTLRPTTPTPPTTVGGTSRTSPIIPDKAANEPVANSYFGPCAPFGTTPQKYRVTALALDPLFYVDVWNKTTFKVPNESSFFALSLKQSIARMSLANFIYYFGDPSKKSITRTTTPSNKNMLPWNFILGATDKGKHSYSADTKIYYTFQRPYGESSPTALAESRTDFFHFLMGQDTAPEEAGFERTTLEGLSTKNYIKDAASILFYLQDDGCELCRFCVLGVLPANSGFDLWEQYGIDSPGGGNFTPSTYSATITRGKNLY